MTRLELARQLLLTHQRHDVPVGSRGIERLLEILSGPDVEELRFDVSVDLPVMKGLTCCDAAALARQFLSGKSTINRHGAGLLASCVLGLHAAVFCGEKGEVAHAH